MLEEGGEPRGCHVACDLSGLVEDPRQFMNWILERARRRLDDAGIHRLGEVSKVIDQSQRNTPPGFAAAIIIDESHFTAHAYTEMGHLSLDLFTCGSTDPRPVLEGLIEDLRERHPGLEMVRWFETPRF